MKIDDKLEDIAIKIRSTRSNIDGIIKEYEQDYKYLADMNKKFSKVNTKEQAESIESEMALIDGFISSLKSLKKCLQ